MGVLRRWKTAAALLLLTPILSCDDNQIEVPVDPTRTVWTRLTDPTGTLPDGSQVKEPSYPDWRGDSVAYHFRAANGRVWLGRMGEHGTGPTSFPQTGGIDDAYPRWVADDQWIYCSNRAGSIFGFDVYYKVPSTGEDRRLTSFVGNELGPVPRPGRPAIAYVEGNNIFRGKIVLLPDTAAVPLTRKYLTADTLVAGEPDWSPDGSRICFTVEKQGARNIWVAEVSDTAITSMTQLTTGGFFDFFPRFSPDGAKIVFTSNRTGRQGIWWVEPAGPPRNPQLISFEDSSDPTSPDDPNVLISPCWSPDGTEILVSSNARGGRALWKVSNLPF